MTGPEIKKIREEAGEDKAMIIVCDNERLFYHNVAWSCPLIWDDGLQRFISFEANTTTAQSQVKMPAKVVYTSYEHIQYIEILMNTKEVIELLNKFKDKMTEEQYNFIVKVHQIVCVNQERLL